MGYERRLASRMILLARVVIGDQKLLLGSTHKVHKFVQAQVRDLVVSHGNNPVVMGGDEVSEFCGAVGLNAVDVPYQNSWPAGCNSTGKVRGDIVCSNRAVDGPAKTLVPCFKSVLLSDHAIKVTILNL